LLLEPAFVPGEIEVSPSPAVCCGGGGSAGTAVDDEDAPNVDPVAEPSPGGVGNETFPESCASGVLSELFKGSAPA